MGRTLIRLIHEHPQAELRAALEAPGHAAVGADAGELAGIGKIGVALGDDLAAVASPDTVALDFTSPPAALLHLSCAVEKRSAIVIGTTGFTEQQREALDRLAMQTRCLIAPNMSVGVNVLLRLVRAAAAALGPSFDPEIFEMHHRLKADAPSGTALALGQAVAETLGRDLGADARFGREGMVGRRTDREIGILALRGGDVVGDHTVIFAGIGERIELTHRAQSRDSFASGAIRAALWLAGQAPGRYSMADALGL